MATKNYRTDLVAGDMEVTGWNCLPTRMLFRQTADATVANTLTETTLIGTGQGTKTIPVTLITLGRMFRIKATGFYGTKASAPGNATVNIRWGTAAAGTSLGGTGAIALTAGVSNRYWWAEWYGLIKGLGTSGLWWTIGNVMKQTAANSAADIGSRSVINTTAVRTVDISASNDLNISWLWSLNDIGNTTTCTNLIIETIG